MSQRRIPRASRALLGGIAPSSHAPPFPALVATIEGETIPPDVQAWSRIVTEAHGVRAGDMRLFQMLMEERRSALAAPTQVWPPPPSI